MNIDRRTFFALGSTTLAAVLAGCDAQDTPEPAAVDEALLEQEVAEAPSRLEVVMDTPGVQVVADDTSPSGYTATFTYDASNSERPIDGIVLSGPFCHVDPSLELFDSANRFAPDQYVAGQYATSFAPGAEADIAYGYEAELTDEDGDGIWSVSLPITSGSFGYSYRITYGDWYEEVTTDDPGNPSPALRNPNSTTQTGDVTHSIVYGAFDPERQDGSPNLDFVLPCQDAQGILEYVPYTCLDGSTQYLGIYTPPNYDASAASAYKTIYLSHGGGGNETDWFAMGHADNIMDNAIADGTSGGAVIVTMDNAHFWWQYDQIERNVLESVIPFVEEQYNVSTEPADRAFGGLSYGSMATMHLFFDYPTQFGYFGMWSGADMSGVKYTEGIDRPIVMAAVGTCDAASSTIAPAEDGQGDYRYEDFEEWAERQELENIHCDGYVPGGHDWFTWTQCFHTFVADYLWKDA